MREILWYDEKHSLHADNISERQAQLTYVEPAQSSGMSFTIEVGFL